MWTSRQFPCVCVPNIRVTVALCSWWRVTNCPLCAEDQGDNSDNTFQQTRQQPAGIGTQREAIHISYFIFRRKVEAGG